jgi:hypothetical protein
MSNEYIDRILKNTVSGDYISLACLDRKNGKFYSNMTNDGQHKSLGLLNKKGYCNYITLNTFLENRRTRENISNLNGFMLDFDDGDIKELVARVENLFGSATWKITTTPSKGKTQLIYLFKEFESRIDLWEKVSYTLTMFAKSDKQTWDLSRVFRHPESINGKNGERTLIEKSSVEYSLDYFVKKLEENSIELVAPELNLKSPADSTKRKKKEIIKKEVNKQSDYYAAYLKFESSKPSPSEARFSFIYRLVAVDKLTDTKILQVCDELNLDLWDCERIIPKIRFAMSNKGS